MRKAREYLQRLQQLDVAINQKIEELSDLRAISKKISSLDYSKDRVQICPQRDASFTENVVRMIDLEYEINWEIDVFVEEKQQNSKHIEILYQRYVKFKRLEQIAVDMNYTYQYVRELHGQALQEFENTYTNLQASVLS